MSINRLSVLDKNQELPVNDLIISNTLRGVLDVIITEDIKYLAFSDLHRLKYPSNFLFESLIPMRDKGFSVIVYEMLPIKSTPYTLKEIQDFFETGAWCGMGFCDEIPVLEYSMQILSKCLELGIEIWGGDDRSTYSAKTYDRYSMNSDIANIIRTLVEAGKKVISFYGNEHNNTRTHIQGYMGIPYYITLLGIPFLVIKDLRMHTDANHYIEPLISKNKDKFIGISAIPEVDFPHYFIRCPHHLPPPSSATRQPREIKKKPTRRKSRRGAQPKTDDLLKDGGRSRVKRNRSKRNKSRRNSRRNKNNK